MSVDINQSLMKKGRCSGMANSFNDLAARAKADWSEDARRVYEAASAEFQAEVGESVPSWAPHSPSAQGSVVDTASFAFAL